MDELDLATVGQMVVFPAVGKREGAEAAVTYFVGPNPGGDGAGDDTGGSQAFRVDLGSGYEIGVHYHVVDQFQVVVAGSGTLGRHPLQPGSVHYVDAHTPYGPIRPGPDGLAYLTLRGFADRGAWWMPASRDDLAAAPSGRPRRNVSADAAAADGSVVAMDDPDGLRIVGYHLEPGEEVRVDATDGSCRFGIVLDGSVTIGDDAATPADLVAGSPATAYVVRSEEGATYLEVDLPQRQVAATA